MADPLEMLEADPELMRVDRESSSVVIRVMLTFDQAADDFLGDCERRGFRPRSVATYRRTYNQFADRLPEKTDVSKITTDDIRRYLNSKNRLAPGTRAGFESHLAALFRWLMVQEKIARNPMLPLHRTRRIPSEDLDVVNVSTEEVKLMLAAAQGWTERLCLGVLVFTGVRRHAAAMLRLSDYDELHRKLRFREKGGKTIWKPVPDELDNLIRAAIAAGVYDGGGDACDPGRQRSGESDLSKRVTGARGSAYLIPNRGPRPHLNREGERDDRFIWWTVKTIAARAGVKCHTHALRAAFAVYYLETHQRDTLALQSLLGHRSGNTTQIYLRKLDRQAEMERVRDLSWGVSVGGDDARTTEGQDHRSLDAAGLAVAMAPQDIAADDAVQGLRGGVAANDNAGAARSSQIADVRFDEDRLVGAGGFEPPEAEDPHQQTPHTKHLDTALAERLDQAVSERRASGREAVQTHEGGAS